VSGERAGDVASQPSRPVRKATWWQSALSRVGLWSPPKSSTPASFCRRPTDIPRDANDLAPALPHTRAPRRGRASSILLVDDSSTIRKSLRAALERWGYRVEEASNGREAWAKLQANRPDMVVSDIDMPIMNGLDLVRLIKSDLVLMNVPVLLITSDPFTHVQSAQKEGVAGLLAKPFDDSALIDQVRFVLQE
jgi:chemosensory pili system protein ChpA (sensor histidine kinase/response regulator)